MAIGDGLNKVSEHQVRVFVRVVHCQAVLFIAGNNGEKGAGGAALNLQHEDQRAVGIFEAVRVGKRAVQIDLRSQQAKGFIR